MSLFESVKEEYCALLARRHPSVPWLCRHQGRIGGGGARPPILPLAK